MLTSLNNDSDNSKNGLPGARARMCRLGCSFCAEVLRALQCDCLADGRVSSYVRVLCGSDSVTGARDDSAATA